MSVASTSPPGRSRPLLRPPWRRKNLRVRVLVPVAGAVLLLVLAEPDRASLAAGALFVLAGEGLRLWATGHLVKTRELAVSGPYRYLRHPLYAGTLLVGGGLILAAGFGLARYALPLGLAHFFLYYLPYKERAETRRLARRHGACFADYHAAVPALLPRLRPWPGGDPDAPWRFARVVDNDELGTLLAVALYFAALVLKAQVC